MSQQIAIWEDTIRGRLQHLKKRIALLKTPKMSICAKQFNAGAINARQAEVYFLEGLLKI